MSKSQGTSLEPIPTDSLSLDDGVRALLSVPWPPPNVINGSGHAPSSAELFSCERSLVELALALGAESVGELTDTERKLSAGRRPRISKAVLRDLRKQIRTGHDPLGDAFCKIRTVEQRRKSGAIYTPRSIVRSMLDWSATVGVPARVIEPGAGSARFLVEAAHRFPKADLVAVETDPLAALMARANLASVGAARRAEVTLADFRTATLETIDGRTLYIGNPPYVRHHLIEAKWKSWLKENALRRGCRASSLAGLHVYFFLAIARWAKAGDYGALITAAEWMDVNYGQLVRDLFLDRLGGQSVFVIEPSAEPFPGTLATGAITTFMVNGKPSSSRRVQ